MEKYLVDIKNIEKRSQVSKFRLSNHVLEIEKGRHKKIPKELRFCHFCPQTTETESHFLFYCPVYAYLREGMLKHVAQHVILYNDEQKLHYFLSKMDKETVEYITRSFELRQFLLEKHKMQN